VESDEKWTRGSENSHLPRVIKRTYRSRWITRSFAAQVTWTD